MKETLDSLSGKKEALRAFVEKRRSEKLTGYHHLHEFDGGFYDCDFVGPWTISACNSAEADASLTLVLTFRGRKFWRGAAEVRCCLTLGQRLL